MPDAPATTLILGVGNLLLRDEGVGIHVIHALDTAAAAATAAGAPPPLPPNVRTLDGGTGGFHLTGTLQENARVIMIDATLDNNPPGTVTVIEPRYPSDFPPLMSAHEVGLRDMLETMMLAGPVPRIHLITISAENINEVGMTLTPAVAAAIPEVIALIKTLLHKQHQPRTNADEREQTQTRQVPL